MQEHPRIAHYVRTGNGRALRFSDLVSRAGLHRLGLYNELFRRLGIEHQMAAIYPLRPGILIGLALNRHTRDYSDRERLLLDVLRPHLAQMERLAERMGALTEALAHAGEALEAISEGVILLDAAGRVRLTTARTREWLTSWFGASRGGTRLPEALARWVRAEQARLEQSDDVPAPLAPLVVENNRRRLLVRLQPGIGRSTLLLEEQVTAPEPVALERLGLSRREAEVLAWVSQGKTNPEIASILGISPRTVQSHLDHIFEKLGVGTRTAAAACALQAAGAVGREPPASHPAVSDSQPARSAAPR
ncbi:MAG: hypothetical protein HY726_02495 [Candidatus Rokubacteria bacterium]|nr:hypothetical protein [Candidatus Rokubacteria bacterium]